MPAPKKNPLTNLIKKGAKKAAKKAVVKVKPKPNTKANPKSNVKVISKTDGINIGKPNSYWEEKAAGGPASKTSWKNSVSINKNKVKKK